MDDKAFFTTILKIHLPWFVKEVAVNEKDQRVDIYIGHEREIQVRCPECGQFYALYDHLYPRAPSPGQLP
ncbi:MAG: hypothetical protein C4576_06770 [Desulfobacteraceae bacterium]|nr:MAG: hypothetical protein C4576_06770 [Desulfobacteraceae bacterium]